MALDFKVKLAEKSDMMDVFYLSNDSAVRKKSFNQEEIILLEHEIWFENKIKNKDCIFYIAESFGGDFIGYVRFDKDNLDSDMSYIVTIHVKEEFRGKGIGTKLLIDVSCILSKKFKNILIYAYIKKENIASKKSFLKAGYEIFCEMFIKGNDCFKLKYASNNKG